MTRASSIAKALVFLVIVARPAAADDTHRRAGDSFEQARAAFARKDYAAAAAAFEFAASLEPHAATLLDAGEAWELAGDPVRAAQDYDHVLALPGSAARYRADAERRLAHVAQRLGTLILEGPPTLLVRIDGSPPVVLPARLRLAPSTSHEIAVAAPGDESPPRTVPITLAPGETRSLDLTPPRRGVSEGAASNPTTPSPTQNTAPTPSPPTARPVTPDATASSVAGEAPLPTHHRGGPGVASWVAFGVAGTATIGAGVLGGLALSAQSRFNDDPTRTHADAFYRWRDAGTVFGIVAVVSAATGLVLWLAQPSASWRTDAASR
jgi:hypothetical protein